MSRTLHTDYGEAAPLLADDGAAAQEARDHHQAAGQDEDVGGDGEGAGRQQAQELALLHQRPHAHAQDGGTSHLKVQFYTQGHYMHFLLNNKREMSKCVPLGGGNSSSLLAFLGEKD